MNLAFAVSVMGLLAIVCLYFWLVRGRDAASETGQGANAGPETK